MLTSAIAFAFLSGLMIQPVKAEPISKEACKLFMELRGALLTEDQYRHAPNRSKSDEASEKEAHEKAQKARAALTARVGAIDYGKLSEKCGSSERSERESTAKQKSADSKAGDSSAESDSAHSQAGK